ncbi:hypothetical protein ACPCSG_33310 [Streptomyces cellulosae]
MDSALPEAMNRFVRSEQQRWPGLYVCGERLEPGAVADWQLPEPSGDYSEIITFSAGQAMEDFRQENGYALDSTGQGPYSVFYGRHGRPLRASSVSGVRAASPEEATAVEGVGLGLSQYYTVSRVTPEDAAADRFSEQVLEDFLASFEAPGT